MHSYCEWIYAPEVYTADGSLSVYRTEGPRFPRWQSGGSTESTRGSFCCQRRQGLTTCNAETSWNELVTSETGSRYDKLILTPRHATSSAGTARKHCNRHRQRLDKKAIHRRLTPNCASDWRFPRHGCQVPPTAWNLEPTLLVLLH